MNRRSVAAMFAGAFVLAGATAAFAATQEYDITVPVTVKGVKTLQFGTGGITISCAVGRAGLAYSTGSGGATGATGSGSTHASLVDRMGKVTPVLDVVVVVTEEAPVGQRTGEGAGTGATQYLCWGKLDNGTTPVNFISGNISGNKI